MLCVQVHQSCVSRHTTALTFYGVWPVRGAGQPHDTIQIPCALIATQRADQGLVIELIS